MKRACYNSSENLFKSVSVHLHCGTILSGILIPTFWVRKGYLKEVYPNPESNVIAIIPEQGNLEYISKLNEGEMLFDDLPEGYLECPISQIKILTFN